MDNLLEILEVITSLNLEYETLEHNEDNIIILTFDEPGSAEQFHFELLNNISEDLDDFSLDGCIIRIFL